MVDFLAVALISFIIFELVLLMIALDNATQLKRLDRYTAPSHYPRLSVLLPARNEAANIGPCLRSLLAQDYPDFEILVLDDHSSDQTGLIVGQLVAADDRVRLLPGRALPSGWLGKHWACHQLAQAARGELLLFTDADTRHHPLAWRDAVAALQAESADLLTALPREVVGSWAERLVVPLIGWSIFVFLPLRLAYRLPWSILSVTIGQFMLFRRAAYEAIGGYPAVRGHGVDDIALGRRIKRAGYRWRLLDGGQRISCRMYTNFGQVFHGLGKNLFATFEYQALPFTLIWLWLGLVFLTPPLLLIWGHQPARLNLLAALAVGLAWWLWGLTHRRFGYPAYLSPLYPLTIGLSVIIAFSSLVLTRIGRATWKGRVIDLSTEAADV